MATMLRTFAALALAAGAATVVHGSSALLASDQGQGQGQGNYSASRSLQIVYLAGAAYCNAPALSNWTCGACTAGAAANTPPLTDVVQLVNHTTDVYGYVGPTAGGAGPVVVAFRGTDPSDLRDWVDDLSLWPEKISPAYCPGCEVHEGFYSLSYLALAGQMWQQLTALNVVALQTPVLVTGHSLGGAMAELCALELKLAGVNVVEAHTFGTPRVGNDVYAQTFQRIVQHGNASALTDALAAAEAFAAAHGDAGLSPVMQAALARRRETVAAAEAAGSAPTAVWRVTHASDIVPHLPPQLFGFRHTTTEVWFDEPSSSYRQCSPVDGEDKTCADSVALPVSVEDHLHYLGVHISGLC